MAASYGVVVLVFGSRGTSVTLEKDIYLDDTAGNMVRWDNGAGASATSDTNFNVPADCKIVDICIASATGQTKTQVNVNNQPTGNMLRNSLHLSTITSRPPMRIPLFKDQKLSLIQLA